MADGIDVFTLYQDVTDWFAVRRAGYAFCYVKVSDGDEYRSDGGYGPAGRAAGLAMGGYHYAQPGNPVAQADLLVARVEAAGLTDLAPALDLEDPFLPDQYAVGFAIAFLRRVRDRGHRPCLYGNQTMLSTVRAPVLAAVPETLVWAARYSTSPPTVPHDVWQWSSSGHIPGISASSVDLNRGAIPYNTRPTTPKEIDQMYDVTQLKPGAGRFHAPVESGDNSSLIDTMWLSASCGFLPADEKFSYEVFIAMGRDAAGNQVYAQPVHGWPAKGELGNDDRGWWEIPQGADSVSIQYTCHAESTPAAAISYRPKN